MKNNTEKAKDLLLQTIRIMPQDFALSEARQHLNLALQKIQAVETKRERREVVQNQEALRRQVQVSNVTDLRDRLRMIDEMIEQEKDNIKQAQKPTTTTDDGTLFG